MRFLSPRFFPVFKSRPVCWIGSRVLNSGDLILLCGGGHSLEMIEESSMIEVKQGPYAGEGDKTRFEDQGLSDDSRK